MAGLTREHHRWSEVATAIISLKLDCMPFVGQNTYARDSNFDGGQLLSGLLGPILRNYS